MKIEFKAFIHPPLKYWYIPTPDEMQNSSILTYGRATKEGIETSKEGLLKALMASNLEKVKEELKKEPDKEKRIAFLKKMLKHIDNIKIHETDYFGNIKKKKEKNYFDRSKDSIMELLNEETFYSGDPENESTNTKNKPHNSRMDLITKEKKGILIMYESNIPEEIKKWNHGKEIELCAAFCNYLLLKDFFTPSKLCTAKNFALASYGPSIDSSIDKLRREKNKELLNQKTERILRLATGKKYG